MKLLKHSALLLLTVFLTKTGAQTCNDYIAQGRSLLEQSNVVDANARFASAVALCPANEVARFYHAVTAVAALPFRPGPSNFMDRIGLPHEGRNLYNWTAYKLPRDTNGHVIVPSGANATEAVTLARNEILPVLTVAELDLAQITSPGFAVPVNYEETRLADVIVDYGDVLLLRAVLNALQFWAYSLSSWNLDVHLNVLKQLEAADRLSIESVLRDYPQLLTFATTNELAAARAALESGVARYLEASAFIRARPANLVRLFNYDLEQADREEKFRCTLVDLRNSLQSPTVLCLDSNYVIYLANYFSPANPPRQWLPRFAGNDIEINSFPDLTFGGIVGGLTEPAVEDFVTRYVDMASTIQNPAMPSAGRFSCEFPTLPDRVYALEHSSDLKNWTKGLEFYSEGGTYAFLDGGARNAAYRFYRLVELYKLVTVKGVVKDACSLAPIANAEAGGFSWLGYPTRILTDNEGRFTIRLYPGFQDVYVTAPGYRSASAYTGREDREQTSYLFPDSVSRPVNADFSGRLALVGLPASVTSANCGTEFAEDYDPWLGNHVVWFTWTSPLSAPVAVHAEGAFLHWPFAYQLITVFTGVTSNDLNLISSGAVEARFQATAGTTYQIAVGLSYYSRPGQFTLRVSSPPALNWLAPAEGAEFLAPATIPFSVNPTDLDGNVVEVTYYANGKKIGEAATAPFDFTWENVPANSYAFEVRALDAQGFVTVESRRVFVRPPNDNFAGRIPLEGVPLRVRGSNKAATLQPGEPPHVAQSIWWSWRTPVAGPCTIIAESPDGGGRDATLLAVYTGSALNQLLPIASNQVVNRGLPLQVSFAAASQTDYQIVVDGPVGDDVQLRFLPTFAPQVAIQAPTNGSTFVAPGPILVQADATDPDNNLSSVEVYANGHLLHASSNSFSFPWTNVPAGWYTLQARAIDAWGVTVLSTPVGIMVRPPPPPNDNFADRIVVTGTNATLTGTTVGATKEIGEPNIGYPFSGNSVWWTWTAPASGTLSLIDMDDWWWEKRVQVFTGNFVSALTSVNYVDDYLPWLSTTVEAGVVYQISIEGRYGDYGSIQFDLRLNP